MRRRWRDLEWIDRFGYTVSALFLIAIALLVMASLVACDGISPSGPTLEPLRPFPTSTTTATTMPSTSTTSP